MSATLSATEITELLRRYILHALMVMEGNPHYRDLKHIRALAHCKVLMPAIKKSTPDKDTLALFF